MPLDSGLVDVVTKGSSADAWSATINRVLEISSRPLSLGNVPHEVVKRDREIGDLDLLLSSSSWDLWQAFSETVKRNSAKLLDWWAASLQRKGGADPRRFVSPGITVAFAGGPRSWILGARSKRQRFRIAR
jgi:hypothetical protein